MTLGVKIFLGAFVLYVVNSVLLGLAQYKYFEVKMYESQLNTCRQTVDKFRQGYNNVEIKYEGSPLFNKYGDVFNSGVFQNVPTKAAPR